MEDKLAVLAEFLLDIASHQMAVRNLIWQSGYTDQQYEQALTDAKAKLDALSSVQEFRAQDDSSQLEPLLTAVKTSLRDPFGG
ncbi:MAG: hypothetical protein ABSH49_36895 [Bryobacteraceae bacterium]|jgi:hypothetical protein